MYRSDTNGHFNTIYILGARGVGKTSLLNILLGREYDENVRKSKIGITTYYKQDDKDLIFKELTDDENFTFTKILKNSLEEIILIIIVFDIDDEDTLEYAKSLILFINNNITYNLGIQIILMGNKYDSKKINNAKIKVNQIEAENFVVDIDNCSFYELSCKTGLNIDIIEKTINEINNNNSYLRNSKEMDKDDLNNIDTVKINNGRSSNSCIVF